MKNLLRTRFDFIWLWIKIEAEIMYFQILRRIHCAEETELDRWNKLDKFIFKATTKGQNIAIKFLFFSLFQFHV